MTRILTRHLTAPDKVARIPHDDLPLAWANTGAVYVNLQDLSLTPDDADTLADALHSAAEEARRQ